MHADAELSHSVYEVEAGLQVTSYNTICIRASGDGLIHKIVFKFN
jgi:hypothetical protein